MRLNDRGISDQDITFVERTRDDQLVVEACLTPEQVDLLGLREDALKMIQWLDGGRCADFSALEGIVLRGDLSESSLQVAMPQAWLEYQDASWLPVSRWEEGIPGLLFDYNLNTNVTFPRRESEPECQRQRHHRGEPGSMALKRGLSGKLLQHHWTAEQYKP
jgi:outer membrane usher protein FimD/PapC